MNSNPTDLSQATQTGRRKLTLAHYVHRRNGVPLSASGSLRNMLYRSLGAGSFASFWLYWNPIFGYYLGKYVYAPLQRILLPEIALVTTFMVCGAIHDAVTIAVRGSFIFLITPWFFFLGLGVVLSRRAKMNFSNMPWLFRACTNVAYVGACLALTLYIRSILSIP